MDKGHYVFDVLYYNTGPWWNCDDDSINKYPGCLLNIYDELLIDKKKIVNSVNRWIRWNCVHVIYLKNYSLHRAPTHLLQGSQYQKKMNILRRV